MTGSGKTGLCLDLLEEAGIDRIPSIVIDPKGDISNLLLTFPDLATKDFRPWIDESQAGREGLSPDEFAAAEAEKWRKGLEEWGQSGERIRKFRDAVDLQVFTPGNNAGRPVTILKSFSTPGQEILDDPDAFRERTSSVVSGLLALLGIDADPIRSREHILLSKLLMTAWSAGRDLDLGKLIGEIQNPPFKKAGILDLDTFYPAKDRMELALSMNNLLASPSFSSWMSGEPLDIKRLLHTEAGKPRISIMSISHLNSAERMFFVTILLNEVISWMRSQSGTSSLRAILYMDEVFGYFPPVANPPSKQPMLTLLKQARAYGLGVVLATQNPVDLDYKGLSNAGTWFLGRLQTERDKARVIEGLEGAAANTGASFDRREIEQILAGLGSRKFLMNNVHDDQPVVFETRWAMSYLCGPLTRSQIQKLVGETTNTTEMETKPKPAMPVDLEDNQAIVSPPPVLSDLGNGIQRKLIPARIEQQFVKVTAINERDQIGYQASLLATGRLHFVRTTYKVDDWTERTFLVELPVEKIEPDLWDDCQPLRGQPDLSSEPVPNGNFFAIPVETQKEKTWSAWEREFKDYLYREQRLVVYKCKELKAFSRPSETPGEFRVRLRQLAAQRRDTQVEKLRKKYAARFDTLRNRIRRAEEKLEREQSQYKQKKMDSIFSAGANILAAVLGRKTMSATNARRAGSSMRSLGRARKELSDVERAEDNLADLNVDWQDMEAKFDRDVHEIEDKANVESLELEELLIRPRKGDLSMDAMMIVWLPYRVDSSGHREAAFRENAIPVTVAGTRH